MFATVIIGAAIALYTGFIIHKRIKDAKAGKYCSCGCDSCPSKCHTNK